MIIHSYVQTNVTLMTCLVVSDSKLSIKNCALLVVNFIINNLFVTEQLIQDL